MNAKLDFDPLLADLGPAAIRDLEELTAARGHRGFRQARTTAIDPVERYLGFTRQEVTRSAFVSTLEKHRFEVSKYRRDPGAPSVFFVAGQFANFTCIMSRVGLGNRRRHRGLAAIASEVLPQGAFYGDLFGNIASLNPPKPLFAWTAIWLRAQNDESGLPCWSGFSRLRAVDDRTVEMVDHMRLGDALLRAHSLEAGAERAEDIQIVQLRRTSRRRGQA